MYIAENCWVKDQTLAEIKKKVVVRECKFFPSKVKETMIFFGNTNHIDKTSYKRPEIKLPNLWSFLFIYPFCTCKF